MKTLAKHLLSRWARILPVILLLISAASLDLLIPGYISGIVDIATGGGETGEILRAGGEMMLITLLSAAATVLSILLASRMAASFSRDIRSELFNKVLGFSGQEMGKFGAASLITRATNDIQQMQMGLVFTLRILVFAPVLGVGALIRVMAADMGMTPIIGLTVGLLALIAILASIIVIPKFGVMQSLLDKQTLVAREVLSGIPVIRAFSREDYECRRFERASYNLAKTNLFVGGVLNVLAPAIMMISSGAMLLIIWVGAGQMAGVGDIMAFIQYAMQVMMSFLMLTTLSMILPRSLVSLGRVAQVLDTPLTITSPKEPETLKTSGSGGLRFKNVTFRYPDAKGNALEEISFEAAAGTTTAIIGATGSGKSTLINLIPRFFEVGQGEITMDGVNISNIELNTLRGKVGLVPQKATLFSGSIFENIAYGSGGASDMEDVCAAADIAQVREFISELEDGFGYNITSGGGNVSGGQRQRLAIARAIAKKPPIYLFDDSFSALDPATDAALQKALAKKTKDACVIIVAQRVSTIMQADNIIVLDKGRMVGQGRHTELLDNCEVYRQIVLSQLPEGEVFA